MARFGARLQASQFALLGSHKIVYGLTVGLTVGFPNLSALKVR